MALYTYNDGNISQRIASPELEDTLGFDTGIIILKVFFFKSS